MGMLDGLRVVFLEALSFADEAVRKGLVEQWNEQCQAVYEYKKALIAEEHYKHAHSTEAEQKSGWISVAERLPEDDLPKDTERRTIRCLVATNKGSVKACVRQRYISPSNGKLTPWCWSRDMFATPTHWMPLPEPPKMKGGAE